MAEKICTIGGSTLEHASDALEKLEQQLACPVCLDRFTQPKTLPCLHSFCNDCLDRFPVEIQQGKNFIVCPVCRQTTQQPDNGVSGFQSAFLVNHLLELHQLLEKVSGSKHSCENCSKEEDVTGFCKQCSMLLCQTCVDTHNKWVKFTSHQILGMEDVAATASKLVPLKERPTIECSSHGKPLEVYCDTCDKLICYLCTTAKAHRNHEYEPLNDAFPRHRQQILDSLDQVKEKLTAITAAINTLKTHEGGFLEQVGTVKKDIKATVQQLIQLLKESEQQLMKELDQVTEAYVEKISACKKETDISIAQLESCEKFAEEELRIGSQQEILVMKKQTVERMAAVCSQVKEDSFRPLEDTKVRFAKSASVLEACRNLGSVVKYGRFEVAYNKTTFDLCSAAPLSTEQVSCHLSSVADPTVVVKCVVHQVAPGSFEVRYSSPSSHGLHQLKVQVGGNDILETPLKIMLPRKAGPKFTDLSRPAGIVFDKNTLIIVQMSKHCVTLKNNGNNPSISRGSTSTGQGRGNGQLQFENPLGVAITKAGHIVVADNANHRLQVLTLRLAFVDAVGSEGSQPLQFVRPCDVAVHHNEKIYVVDNGNNRVQVLNADYSYSHCFGSKGAQPGEFANPCRIAIDALGLVYVSDNGNNRVQKFTPEGTLLSIIDRKGSEGPLRSPCGLCVDGNDILYVTELASVKTVCMFSTTSEQFLGYIGGNKDSTLTFPWFITSDGDGKIYISDKLTGEVVIY